MYNQKHCLYFNANKQTKVNPRWRINELPPKKWTNKSSECGIKKKGWKNGKYFYSFKTI